MPTYKNPLDLANALNQKPEFNKEGTIEYLKQFASSETDDDYEKWAKGQGKTLKPKTPFDPGFAQSSYKKQYYGDAEGSYSDQYLADEDYLKKVYNDIYDDIDDYYAEQHYKDIDADYERSFGPVDTRSKYAAYQKWLKEGN